jgi:CheY-like chemotaxis protein
VGPDKAWRLLTTLVFEEAGYAVYAAADRRQAVAFTTRLLPDVVVVQMETPDMLDILAQLSEGSSTYDISVVVLASSLQSTEARRAREAGAVTLLADSAEGDVLVGEVDSLIAAAPRAQRTLKRRLLGIKELARYYTPDGEGQARLRHLIDRLQVAILAVDEEGHCIAASEGATMLTGYSRQQLLTTSVYQEGLDGGHVSDERWRGFLANRPRAQRTLKRRLFDIKELAKHYTPDAEGQARLQHLIDRLQVAILAVDKQGHCIAASPGPTPTITDDSRLQLLTSSVFHAGFDGGHASDERWRGFLGDRHCAWTTTITNRAGEDLTVHAAGVEIVPGFHVAAFAAA